MRLLHDLLLAAAFLGSLAAAEPKRILFLAGSNSHAWGQHKHIAGSQLLCDALNEGSLATAEVTTGWPDAATLGKVDALVIYADGWHAHPANDKLGELEAFMNAGKGLVALHWATGIQAADPESKEQGEDPRRAKWRALMGADFEAYHSISNFWKAGFDGKSGHPVMRGVKPFSLYDECYFHLRECDHGAVNPLWRTLPPVETIEGGLSPYRGNDKARASLAERKETQYVAWTYPRKEGGRAFGFTGGHFHWSWAQDEVRKMVLNGILWSAGGEVPAVGVGSKTPDAARMLAGLPDKNPGWSEAALQAALDKAAGGEVVPWLEFTDTPLPAPPVSLFDGKSLDGWQVLPGDEKWWRVEDGTITGGSLETEVPHNTFLATAKRYANFELQLKVRLVNGSGFVNSGIQIRSIRVPDSAEMSGYQVDAGPGWWGKLYDESRRNKVVGEPVDAAAIRAEDFGWNDYRILCEGRRIRTWINGVAALDYTEANTSIPQDGLIGLQAHSGGKMLARFKDIQIRELPATEGIPLWEDASARSPEREMAAFQVPDGFEVELVASEKEGVGKPVTMAWDHAGRMWTMTALEYPVDANENQAQAEALYARGGKDRVLVFDEPWKPGPQVPRVFAEGLAIPLGMMPWKGGALVQHGHEIRYYEDLDKDGAADRHRLVLEGFGIQDSHLFPHQFERSPGGWFYLAQGLFNHSKVVRPDGRPFSSGAAAVDFNQCKLARAKLDGSDFELLTAGPNNIWGLAVARDGREFLQEANDLGHPVSEFVAGTHYPTGSSEKLRSYAPQLPASTPGQPMGGTGLSGLALADEGAFSAAWPDRKVFYVANPITNRIQIVTLENGDYQKQADFLVSGDDWFRPVAIHFGPDGCLYIADWYNKVISHNEVPRNHPDRDKTRGRIWRIKPKGWQAVATVDLTTLEPADLLGRLGDQNARVGRMAWQEIADRGDKSMVPALREIAVTATEPSPRRLGALWALREMGEVPADWVLRLASDRNADIRREAVECWGDIAVMEADFVAVAGELGDEPDFQVCCELANALRRQKVATAAMTAALVRFTPPPSADKDRGGYEASFLRYLIRWALEVHPQATRGMMAGSLEERLLACLALPPEEGARGLLEALPGLARPLTAEEVALLGGQLAQPAVAAVFGDLLDDAATREQVLKALLQLDPGSANNPVLRAAVARATASLLADPEALSLVTDLARRFRLGEIAPQLIEKARSTGDPAILAGLLRTLNEVQAADPKLASAHLDSPDERVAREAIIGYASAGGMDAAGDLARRWPELPGAMRQFVIGGMLANPESAAEFARRISEGEFAGIDPSALEKLAVVLGTDHPAFRDILSRVDGLLAPVIRFTESNGGGIPVDLTLDGPFTIETWIKLDAGIDNRDGLLFSGGNGADINFYDRRLRLYDGARDVVIADRPVESDRWVHCAVTRDPAGKVALFLDGEAVGESSVAFMAPLGPLVLGRANRDGGTSGRVLGFRIWNEARGAEQVRDSYRTRFPSAEGVPGLSWLLADVPADKGMVIEWTADFPELLTPGEAQAEAAKFDRFRAMAVKPGDPAAGAALFQATCMICHPVRGEGVMIGPELGGAGAMGVESLLRNILTPNAKLESGYYRHDVALRDGGFVSGFLAAESASTLVLRPLGSDERSIPKAEVKSHVVSKRSLMPEGLLEGFREQQVADLFSYLMTLK
ncbi:PVC-type heme-binding CxxCH protein [Luteolibacter marinus]|uniref:PVC-type heme-binding CxxCH protein n=1 Tax=Luteolibacter marinus TaxID=2776705 RepID=UPI001866C829|nr:PVC-type heme-binding CxxCH protein [Luteolibacter marinus]